MRWLYSGEFGKQRRRGTASVEGACFSGLQRKSRSFDVEKRALSLQAEDQVYRRT